MRPSKHATHTRSRAQEVFAISIARLESHQISVPVVATAERDAITLFVWDAIGGQWRTTRIVHAPVEAVRGAPSISNTWNWSRRVGLASLDELVYLVYKRAVPAREGETQQLAQLMLETFSVDADGRSNQVLRVQIPMPTFVREIAGFPPRIEIEFERPGFELWAGIDVSRRRLLVVTQTLGERATPAGGGAELLLLTGDLDRLDQNDGWQSRRLDPGGYGLDVRTQGDELILAYRTTPESLRVPLPITQIDPFFSGWPLLELDGSAESDQFLSPLRIMRVDLVTLSTSTLDLPGGEHPRIQSVNPLLVVVDRPQLRVRFRVVTNAEGASDPQIDWEVRGVHKLTFMLDDMQRIARGVLMSFLEGDRPSLPRTAAPWVDVQDLVEISLEGVGWASTWARFPLEPLQVGRDDKGLFFDFLHKTPLFALQRSRARMITDFAQGLLTLADLQSAVYDINHAQIAAPDVLRPDATGENEQFAPFERLSQQSGNVLRAPAYLCDNTIGGSLVVERDGIPYQFLSYTDLGDGGLRVIYDVDLGPPGAPPPVEKPKTLEPESVSGPGSGDERWIELRAADWQDAGVPAIKLRELFNQPTITSSVHSQIESLLEAGFRLVGLSVDEENGWSDVEVNSVQTAINRMADSTSAETRFDTGAPRAFIRMLPPTVIADADTVWEAGIEGEEVTAVSWRFTLPLIGIQPMIVNVAGNPATVSLLLSGDWTVRAEITRSNGSLRTFETVVTIEESLFRRIAGVHSRLSAHGLDAPLNAIGNYRIGTATFNLLQYELRFPVESDFSAAHRIVIKTLDKTDAQWRFRANGTDQGLIDYRLRIRFSSKDFRLQGLLGTLINLEGVEASFFYGRSYTPGVLMNDTRSAVPTSGADASKDGLRRADDSASVPRLASALTARPHRDAQITEVKAKVKVSMLPQAVAAGVITLLVGLGAATAAATLTALVGLLGVALAAAAAPLVGVGAAAAAVAAAVAVALFIAFVVPPIVEASIEESVRNGLTNDEAVQGLEDARFLQFAGEGVAETVARQVIASAVEDGVPLDPSPVTPEAIGQDRYRQNVYQMIHVSEGRCRVLVRT